MVPILDKPVLELSATQFQGVYQIKSHYTQICCAEETTCVHFKSSSRSNTDFSNLIRTVVRLGNGAVGVLCAVTRAG